jgi:phosphatidylserine decarboxylase
MSRRLHVVEQPVKRTWAFWRVEDAIAAMCAGQMVIVVDDEDRENEGHLTIAFERSRNNDNPRRGRKASGQRSGGKPMGGST